jgi:hypothetical protein
VPGARANPTPLPVAERQLQAVHRTASPPVEIAVCIDIGEHDPERGIGSDR